MDSSSKDVVEKQFRAYAAQDLRGFLAAYAADAAILDLSTGLPRAKGYLDIQRVYGEFFKANPKMSCELLHRAVNGDFVSEHARLTRLTGEADRDLLAIHEVKHGRIVRSWIV